MLIDKTARPEEINTWLKNGRKFSAMPDVTNTVDAFGETWTNWWVHLQPKWRGKAPPFSTDAPEGADWSSLQKGGPNGFFLVLLAYCWWGSACIDGKGNEIQPAFSKWFESFVDMEWVLECMVHELECSAEHIRKNTEEYDNDNGPVTKRFVVYVNNRVWA